MRLSRQKTFFVATALVVIAFFVGGARVASAAGNCGSIPFFPAVGIPGSPFVAGERTDVDCTSIGTYIKSLYTYSIYVAAVAAGIVLMVGGFLWLTAGGNANQVGSARAYIGGALSGFVLLLLSWTLLQTINPNLTTFRPLNIPAINNVALETSSANACCTCMSQTPPFCMPSPYSSESDKAQQILDDCAAQGDSNNCTIVNSRCEEIQACQTQLLRDHKMGPCDIVPDCFAGYTCNKAWTCDSTNVTGTAGTAGDVYSPRFYTATGCCMPKQSSGAVCGVDINCASEDCTKPDANKIGTCK